MKAAYHGHALSSTALAIMSNVSLRDEWEHRHASSAANALSSHVACKEPLVSRAGHWMAVAAIGFLAATFMRNISGNWGDPVVIGTFIGVSCIGWLITEPIRLRWRFGIIYLLLGISIIALFMGVYSKMLTEVFQVQRTYREVVAAGGNVQLSQSHPADGWIITRDGRLIPEFFTKLMPGQYGEPQTIELPLSALRNGSIERWGLADFGSIVISNKQSNSISPTAIEEIDKLGGLGDRIRFELLDPTREELDLVSHYRGNGWLELNISEINVNLDPIRGASFGAVTLIDIASDIRVVTLLQLIECNSISIATNVDPDGLKKLKSIEQLPSLILSQTIDGQLAGSLSELKGLRSLTIKPDHRFYRYPDTIHNLYSFQSTPSRNLALAKLAQSKSLRELRTTEYDLTLLQALAEHSEIETLELTTIDEEMIEAISSIRSLKTLIVHTDRFEISHLEGLSSSPNIETIRLDVAQVDIPNYLSSKRLPKNLVVNRDSLIQTK